VRAFGDGFVALLLPIYLVERGFSALAIGAIVTGTLIGTAVMTLWVGWIANWHSRRLLLLAAAVLMAATGAGFAVVINFWPLLVIAIVGTMNPTSGDASIFVPLEQTVLTQTIEPRRRTALFARYSVIGSCATALGVLASAFPDAATAWTGCTRTAAMQAMFALYAVLGLVAFLLYRPLSPVVEIADTAPTAPLGQSKRLVYGMAALFGIGFIRHRLSGAVSIGTVALQGLSGVTDDNGDDPVLEQPVLGGLLSARGADCGAHRAHQYDGVHSSAVEYPAGPNSLFAQPCDRDCAAAGAQCLVADGCANQDLIRDGGRDAGRAAGRRQHNRSPKNFRLGGRLADLGLFADAFDLRMAAFNRRFYQRRLRHPSADQVSESTPARGGQGRRKSIIGGASDFGSYIVTPSK
jgi:hypothetical protein